MTSLCVPQEGDVEGSAEYVGTPGVVWVDDESMKSFPLCEHAHELGLEVTTPLTKAFASGEVCDDVGRERFPRIHAIGNDVQCFARRGTSKE